MKKRIISLTLCVVLAFSCLSFTGCSIFPKRAEYQDFCAVLDVAHLGGTLSKSEMNGISATSITKHLTRYNYNSATIEDVVLGRSVIDFVLVLSSAYGRDKEVKFYVNYDRVSNYSLELEEQLRKLSINYSYSDR